MIGEKAKSDIHAVGRADLVILVFLILKEGAHTAINISYEAILTGPTAPVGFSILLELLVGRLEGFGLRIDAPCYPERV